MNFFPKALKIPKNAVWESGWGNKNTGKVIKNIYLYLVGTYTSLDASKSLNVDDLYHYDANSKKTSTLLNKERDRVLTIIKSVPEKNLINDNE